MGNRSEAAAGFCYLLCFVFLQFPPSCLSLSTRGDGGRAPLLRRPKPDPSKAAATARWLAAENDWGVLSTISGELGGAPFGNVVSFSDGLPGNGNGIPYFYLTTLDPTARNALKDARSSLTISEFPLGTCGRRDPENPTCSKLTLTGKLKLIDSLSKDAEFARQALFSKHSEMKGWPADHNFQIFTLDIEDLFLIDWFGGPKPLSVADYLNQEMLSGFKAPVDDIKAMLAPSISINNSPRNLF